MSNLNANYFKYVCNKHVINDYYVGYIPKGHPIILYSLVDATPLAALHIEYSKIDKPIILTELNESKPKNQMFQNVLSTDNEEMKFVITNLCADGIINFNLMKNDSIVDKKEPDDSLNHVNELKPFDSYEVIADQTVGNKLIKILVNQSETLLSDEVKSTNDKIGTYIYPVVFPQSNNKELCDKFSKTVWKPSDYIVIKQKELPNEHKMPKLRSKPQTNMWGDRNIWNMSFINDGELKSLSHGDNSYIRSDSTNDLMSRPRYMGKSLSIRTGNDLFESSHQDVYKSKVGNFGYGENVKINSCETDYEYNFNLQSSKCVIGFSVLENLLIADRDTTSTIKKIDDYINQQINDDSKTLLDNLNKVYESNDCCICMDKIQNETSDVYYKCGHKCVHSKCGTELNKCPMCRENIYFKIKI